jgi:hypothetical protein
MNQHSETEALKKREKIQNHFWNQVGSDEHISLPMLEDAIKKEFNYKDDRSIQAQVKLMQTEARIEWKAGSKFGSNSQTPISEAKTNLVAVPKSAFD